MLPQPQRDRARNIPRFRVSLYIVIIGKQTVTVLHSLDTAVQIVLRNPFSSLMAAVQ